MLCLRYGRLLVPYIECDLDERVRAKVERHVSRCARCAAELEVIRSVSGAIKSAEAPAMEPAPDLWAKVSARIEREAMRSAPRPWIRVTQTASACAAAVFVAVVGVSLMHPNLPQESARPSLLKKEAPAVESRVAESRGAEPAGPAVAGLPRPDRAAPVESTRVAAARMTAPAPRMRAYTAKQPVAGKWFAAAPPPDSYDKKDAAPSGDKEAVAERAVVGTTLPMGAAVGGSAMDRVGIDGPARESSDEAGNLARGAVAAAPAAAPPTSMYLHAAAKPSVGGLPSTTLSRIASGTERASATSAPTEEAGVKTDRFYAGEDLSDHGSAVARGDKGESVVDALNKTEGVRIAALFTYP